MSDNVEIALISGLCVAVPAIVTQLVSIIISHKKLDKIEVNTNNMNTELRKQASAASSRADSAEGQLKGTKDEQERMKT